MPGARPFAKPRSSCARFVSQCRRRGAAPSPTVVASESAEAEAGSVGYSPSTSFRVALRLWRRVVRCMCAITMRRPLSHPSPSRGGGAGGNLKVNVAPVMAGRPTLAAPPAAPPAVFGAHPRRAHRASREAGMKGHTRRVLSPPDSPEDRPRCCRVRLHQRRHLDDA
jgi:hypothetical protein